METINGWSPHRLIDCMSHGTSLCGTLIACLWKLDLFAGTVTLVLCTVTTHYALYLFVLTANAVGANTYLDAVGLAIGYRMRVFAKTCTLLLQVPFSLMMKNVRFLLADCVCEV